MSKFLSLLFLLIFDENDCNKSITTGYDRWRSDRNDRFFLYFWGIYKWQKVVSVEIRLEHYSSFTMKSFFSFVVRLFSFLSIKSTNVSFARIINTFSNSLIRNLGHEWENNGVLRLFWHLINNKLRDKSRKLENPFDYESNLRVYVSLIEINEFDQSFSMQRV